MYLISCTKPTNDTKVLIDVKKCKHGISIEGYGLIHDFKQNPDTVQLNSDSYLVLQLYSCSGEMSLLEYNKEGKIITEGSYKEADSLTLGISENINPFNGESIIDTTYNYFPKRISHWKYYDKSGKVIKELNY